VKLALTPTPSAAFAPALAATPPVAGDTGKRRGDGLRRFYRRTTGDPHLARARSMLRAHPELKSLVGPSSITLFLTIGVVAAQLGLAMLAGRLGIGWALVLAYAVGAWGSHVAWVLIHEATHGLVSRRRWVNHVTGLLANVPLLIPSYLSFRRFHLLHHRHQGDYRLDADLPSVAEARALGRGPFGKALWLLAYPICQVTRLSRFASLGVVDRNAVLNILYTLAVDAVLVVVLPWQGVAYLAASLFFSVGLHPLGARWIQEHYVLKHPQETYSCYSKANALQLNVGCHVEHHDLPFVAWNRLNRVRAIAPEYFRDLHAHTSWTRLLFHFLFTRDVTLFSRVVGPRRVGVPSPALTEPAPADATPGR